MTPEELKKLSSVLSKMSSTIVSLNKRVIALESRNEELEKEVLRLRVKELSREMKGA